MPTVISAFVLRGEVETLGDDRPKLVFVEVQVIRRGDDHFGIGIAFQQRVGRIGHAGGRVAAHGFAEHLFFADFRDVFENQAFVFIVGHHEEILRRNHFCEAFVGVADEGFARPENVEELFGHRLPAHWARSASRCRPP